MASDRQQRPGEAQPSTSAQDGTCADIKHRVKVDIRRALSNCRELKQLTKTAPKVSQATLRCLSLPKQTPVQEQVELDLHDVCDFAKWKTAALNKQRAVKTAQRAEQEHYAAAVQEALQGWQRQKQQALQQSELAKQQHLEQQMLQAKQAAARIAHQAKQDLLVHKLKQQQQREHTADLHQQLTSHFTAGGCPANFRKAADGVGQQQRQ